MNPTKHREYTQVIRKGKKLTLTWIYFILQGQFRKQNEIA
jgi:hypothetical protein